MNRKQYISLRSAIIVLITGIQLNACGFSPAPKVLPQVNFVAGTVLNIFVPSMNLQVTTLIKGEYPLWGIVR